MFEKHYTARLLIRFESGLFVKDIKRYLLCIACMQPALILVKTIVNAGHHAGYAWSYQWTCIASKASENIILSSLLDIDYHNALILKLQIYLYFKCNFS